MAKLLILFRLVPFRSISYRRLGPGFHPHPNLLPSREKGPDRLHGNDGRGLNPGPIWPCLASLTPTVEAGNGATLASFGTPLTPTHRASMKPRWPWLASLRVARSGETFNSVAFGCISLLSCRLRGNEGGVQEWPTFNSVSFGLIPSHSSRRLGPEFHPHPRLLPSREKGPDRLHGNVGSRWRHRRVETESLGRGQAPVVYLGYARDRTG